MEHMLEQREVRIIACDPAWPERFREEASWIVSVFGAELLSIHHIGSTSIPGMSAKPIIDIMPVVRDISKVETFNEAMIEHGYKPMGEYGITGRRFFIKNAEVRTHHVHSYQPDNPEVKWHLDFRDYLIAHEDEARRYAELKVELAERHRYDLETYTQGKAGFIKSVLAKAHAWRLRSDAQGYSNSITR
jgi:GrpB-like predicted nucleotidyltransferase (UPF0157 family)